MNARGRAGSQIVKEQAARGHYIVAVARKPEKIAFAPGVVVKARGGSDAAQLSELIRGSDAVISVLHFEVSYDTLLAALKQGGVGQMLVTGGAASLEVVPGKRVIDSPTFPADWKAAAVGGIVFLETLCQETTELSR